MLNDDKDETDNGSIQRIPAEEIEDELASSGVDKDEILHVFRMEGFGLPVTISVDNQSELKRPKLGGKVFYKRQWISATNFVIKVRKNN